MSYKQRNLTGQDARITGWATLEILNSSSMNKVESLDVRHENFVDADAAGKFLGLTKRRVLEMARNLELPGHPLGSGKRRTWRFRLSELSSAVNEKNWTYTSATAPGINGPRQPLRRR
jgi:hypothetical protein